MIKYVYWRENSKVIEQSSESLIEDNGRTFAYIRKEPNLYGCLIFLHSKISIPQGMKEFDSLEDAKRYGELWAVKQGVKVIEQKLLSMK